MTAVLLAVLLSDPFDDAVALRRFDEAMELATCDSLRAEVLYASGDEASAAYLMGMVHAGSGSAGSLARLWTFLADGAEGGAAAAQFVRELRSLRDEPDPDELAELWSVSVALGDTAVADSLATVLVRRWPDSDGAAEVLSSLFWDPQYAVWSDPGGRIAVLEEFIEGYGRSSTTWRSRAWQFLVASRLETADSSMWREDLSDWLESCPGDPLPRLTGAALAIDRDSAWTEAAELAGEGIHILMEPWDPADLLPREEAITVPAVYADMAFRGAWCLMELGRPAEASDLMAAYLADDDYYSVDDHHTLAAAWWLEGQLRLRRNSFDAADAFLRSAELGDTGNRWAPLALTELENLWGPRWPDSARALRRYEGPVFEDATGMLSDSAIPAGRVSWCDFDGDGWPDLQADGRLFRNIGGTAFEEVTGECGLGAFGATGGVWGDLDGDGDQDVVTSGSTARILLNDDGVFSDQSCRLGVHPTEGPVEGIGLCDWDADGRLDVYLACYERAGTLGEGCPDRFYLGRDGGFDESLDSLGMTPFGDEPLCGRGVSPCDYDRDGDVDIFVSDYRLQENLLWRNDGGTASDAALEAGVAGHDKDGWWGHTIGSAWGDLDCDGDWDLFSANLAHPRYIDLSDRSELLVNSGGVFSDERAPRGIRYEETHSVPVWGDWDNDGLLDLYVTSIYEGRRSFLYLQQRDGTFIDATLLSGTRVFNGWGAAAADFDRDGGLDLAVGSGSGMRLLRNASPGGSWLEVSVIPPAGVNPSALGCTVELVQGGRHYLRQVQGGSGTTCQDGAVLHFGLAGDEPVAWELFVPGSAEPAAQGVFEDLDRIVSVP